MPTNRPWLVASVLERESSAVYISGFRPVFPKNCEHVTRRIFVYLMDSCSVNKYCSVAAVSDISTLPTWSALIYNTHLTLLPLVLLHLFVNIQLLLQWLILTIRRQLAPFR